MSVQRRVVCDYVDLTESPESSPRSASKRRASVVAAAAASGVAAMPREVVLLGSDDDDNSHYGAARFGASPRRKRQRRQQLATTTNGDLQPPPARFKTDRDDDGNPIVLPPPPPVIAPVLPEHTVLEYFPDADLPFVQNLLKKLVNPDGSNTPNIEHAINYMAENGYEKCKQGKFFIPNAAAGATAAGAAAAVIRRQDGGNNGATEGLLDFMSTESFPVDFAYRNQAQLKLEQDFPCLSVDGTRAILLQCKNHYAIAHDRIVAALKGTATTAAARGSLEETRMFNSCWVCYDALQVVDGDPSRYCIPHCMYSLRYILFLQYTSGC